MVHQDVALDTAVQLTLEFTPTEALPDEDPADPPFVLNERVGLGVLPLCVRI